MPSIDSVLRAVAPRANPKFVPASANAGAIMAKYGISTPAAQAELLAQMAHETMGFTAFVENLNYSAPRLRTVWPKRFPTDAAAQACEHNPQRLANAVYNGRMGNAVGSNDGWDFRGSGGVHHTGRSEFERVKRRTGLDVVANPTLLRDPAAAEAMWHGACSYFVDRGAVAAAKAGDTRTVTVKVNGGTIGLADRITLKNRAVAALDGKAIIVGDQTAAAPALITQKTTAETATDTPRTAQQATTAAAASGPASSGTTKSTGTDWGTAIVIGAVVVIALAAIAVVLWRRAKQAGAALETLELEALKARATRKARAS